MKLDELQSSSGLELGGGGEQRVPVHRSKQLMAGGVGTPPAQLEILDCDFFFKHVADRVPTVDFRDTCEDQITTTEADAVIGRPSNRGRARDFYKRFWEHVNGLLHRVLVGMFQTSTLPPTMRPRLIASIPKPNEDPKKLQMSSLLVFR